MPSSRPATSQSRMHRSRHFTASTMSTKASNNGSTPRPDKSRSSQSLLTAAAHRDPPYCCRTPSHRTPNTPIPLYRLKPRDVLQFAQSRRCCCQKEHQKQMDFNNFDPRHCGLVKNNIKIHVWGTGWQSLQILRKLLSRATVARIQCCRFYRTFRMKFQCCTNVCVLWPLRASFAFMLVRWRPDRAH